MSMALLVLTASATPGKYGATLFADELSSKPQLREVIVSHTDENGIFQLYRMKEDGTESRQLTKGDYH